MKTFRKGMYKIVWKIYKWLYLLAYNLKIDILGIYRLLFVFQENEIYIFENSGYYYKYIGDGMFLEGNRMFNDGIFAIETHGRFTTLSIRQLGSVRFKTLQESILD